MKKIITIKILLAIILWLPASCFGAITLVHSASNATSPSGATTLTVSLGATATAGNIIVLTFGDTGGNTPTSVQTNTSVALTSAVTQHASTGLGAIYYLPNVGSGVTSVTATFTFDVATAALMEYSGVAPSSPLDKTASKDNGFSPGTTAWDSSTTATLTKSGDLVVGFGFEWRLGAQTFTAGAGYTGVLTSANGSVFVEHILGVSGTAGQDATGTISVNTNSQTYGLVATFLSSSITPSLKIKGNVKLKGNVKIK